MLGLAVGPFVGDTDRAEGFIDGGRDGETVGLFVGCIEEEADGLILDGITDG